jgi:hydroxypyruvate isomerase
MKQTVNVITALKKAAEILEPHGLVMVLESLSDNPDLFLRHTDQAFMICKAVNSPACKFLDDMYHMQRNEGNIIANIDKVWDEIGYFQIGDNPGRKEPGTGEMNYKNIFKHIYEKGYKGILGMEHGISIPGKEGEMALLQKTEGMIIVSSIKTDQWHLKYSKGSLQSSHWYNALQAVEPNSLIRCV